MKYAPIVLFAYNRPEHTKQTIQALAQNSLSGESEITIYSDAPKSTEDIQGVEEVRDYLETISGFKTIRIIKQEENQGLAKSIISGVTQSVRDSGRTIVLEDDMLTSPYFLKYMNEALDFYRNDKRVMHITGWSYPISRQGLDDGFLWRAMNCWGWATWEDRWVFFQKDVPALYKQVPVLKRRHFDLMGRRKYWSEVAWNKSGEISSWAVFWYAAIYLRSGLCANPTESLVQNIGLDGTGVHCRTGYNYLAGSLSQKSEFKFQSMIKENQIALDRILKFYDEQRGPYLWRIIRRLKRMFV